MEYGIVTYTRLHPSQKEQVDAIAAAEDKTVAAIVREAVKQYLAARATTPTRKTRMTTKLNATAR